MNHMKVVYTALFGNYDQLISAPISSEEICYICFTDQKINDPKGWHIVQVDSETSKFSKAMLNRYYKINPHLFFSDYESSLYVDANIEILNDPSLLFDKYLKNANIAVPKHFSRNCIFAEATECIIVGKDKASRIRKQMKKYKAEGMPEKFGLGENNIIFRNHNNLKVKKIMEEWWHEMNTESSRDQLSFGYILWKNKSQFIYMDESSRVGKGFFKYHLHNEVANKRHISKIHHKLSIKFREVIYSNLKY